MIICEQVLDVPTANFLTAFGDAFASIEHLSIPEQRASIKRMFHIPEHFLEPIAKVDDNVIDGRHGKVPIRVFTPKLEASLPAIVYFHRGGWVYGSIQESEMICRKLANATGSTVIAVEYRLAPEHQFPVPLEDCYDAAKWAAAHYSKIIVAGESAGGNLAAAVALMAKDTKEFSLSGQLLMYPVLTSDLNAKHYQDSPDKSLLTYENMQFFWGAYLKSPESGDNPYASPLKSPDLSELPPAFIITADYDALKHEGEEYGKKLGNAKVKCYPHVIHGFLDLPLREDVREEAMNDIVEWIQLIH